jgi:hypothetical protein
MHNMIVFCSRPIIRWVQPKGGPIWLSHERNPWNEPRDTLFIMGCLENHMMNNGTLDAHDRFEARYILDSFIIIYWWKDVVSLVLESASSYCYVVNTWEQYMLAPTSVNTSWGLIPLVLVFFAILETIFPILIGYGSPYLLSHCATTCVGRLQSNPTQISVESCSILAFMLHILCMDCLDQYYLNGCRKSHAA